MSRPGPRLLAWLAPALLILLPAAPASGAPRGWWDRDWKYRSRVVISKSQRWPDAPAVRVRFGAGGRVRPDGADLRVVTTEGKEVPRRVLAQGPGDLVEVAFPAGRETEWFVYYGNPDAAEPKETFRPGRGLVLTTYIRGSGVPDDWAGMERILENSTERCGGESWKRVFDAENPFGPSDDYVSDYRGWIFIPADGVYEFFTASDEASFLFVDDQLVASWPGWHNASRGAWAVFKGRAELKAGSHPFRYVHVERRGNQAMAAYWKPPRAAKGTVIPESAFPGLLTAEVLRTESRDTGVTADFVHQTASKWGLDEQVFVALTMKAQLAGPGAKYRWSFGDGTSGTGPIVTHVYLNGGSTDVALTIETDREKDTVVRTIHLPDTWTRFDRNCPEVLDRFARLIAAYPGEKLTAEALGRLEFLLAQADGLRELAEVLRAAVHDGRVLAGSARHRAALRLGELSRDFLQDRDGALSAFRAAAAAGSRAERLAGQVVLAEALLQLGGDPATALRLLLKARESLGGAKGDAVRRAWLRTGDAQMLLGESRAAREAYARALDLAGGAENTQRILRKAGATRSALTCLETGDLGDALKALREWEWLEPTDRWLGLHRITTAKVLLARGEADLAARELTGLVAGNRESEYADQALFLLAGIARERGDDEAADAYRERLRTEYPWSPLAK